MWVQISGFNKPATRKRVVSQKSRTKSVDRLLASAKLAEATKKGYLMRLNQYLKTTKQSPDEFVAAVRAHPKKFEEGFVVFLQGVARKSSSSTTMSFRDSVKRFLEINRVAGVNWAYVNEFVPSAKRTGQDRAPTQEEIRRILDVADLRTKCLVLFLCSSGARVGAVPYLRWRDVEEVKAEGRKFAKVVIYRGEPEAYITFVTPECYRLWSGYREMRENLGEKVTGASHLFTTMPNTRGFDPGQVKPVSVKTLKNMLGELLKKLGMRSVITDREGYRNYEFKQAHGFRKFFKTRMEMSGVKPIITEMLMGHAIGVSGSYMKPTQQELTAEYAKAIENLTIVEKQPEKVDVKGELKKQLLLVAGFSEDEIGKMDFSKGSDEDFQKLMREKLLGTMANNGNHQRVISIGEVEAYISQGWEYVAELPQEKAVLKLPN
jgi:integrase